MRHVIAGPNHARMFGGLEGSVGCIEQPALGYPPLAGTAWAAEAGSGKWTIILDRRLVQVAMFSSGCSRAPPWSSSTRAMRSAGAGADPESLHALDLKAILIQATAHRGEKDGARHDYPGYGPIGHCFGAVVNTATMTPSCLLPKSGRYHSRRF